MLERFWQRTRIPLVVKGVAVGSTSFLGRLVLLQTQPAPPSEIATPGVDNTASQVAIVNSRKTWPHRLPPCQTRSTLLTPFYPMLLWVHISVSLSQNVYFEPSLYGIHWLFWKALMRSCMAKEGAEAPMSHEIHASSGLAQTIEDGKVEKAPISPEADDESVFDVSSRIFRTPATWRGAETVGWAGHCPERGIVVSACDVGWKTYT